MVPHQCLVGALAVRRHEFCVFLVRHLDSALPFLLKAENKRNPRKGLLFSNGYFGKKKVFGFKQIVHATE